MNLESHMWKKLIVLLVIGHEIINLAELIKKELNGEQLSVREQISGAASQVKIYNAASSIYGGGHVYTFGLSVDAIADGVYFGYSAFQGNQSEFISARSKFLTSLNYSLATSIVYNAISSTATALGAPLLGYAAIAALCTSYTTGLLKSYVRSYIGEGGYMDYGITMLDNTIATIAKPANFAVNVVSLPLTIISEGWGWLDEDQKFQNHIHALERGKELNNMLALFTPKSVYDFEQNSIWYQKKIDKTNELESYKRHFKKLNAEKLYSGIYKFVLEKKYDLINSGKSADDAEVLVKLRLKTNIIIKAPEVGDYSEDSLKYLYKYDVCFEMNNYEHGKLYHCYSNSTNAVDSIFINSSSTFQYDQSSGGEIVNGHVEHANIVLEM